MPALYDFLVVDDHRDNRFLLVRTLARKFPGSHAHECDDSTEARQLARSHKLTAAIVHRAADMEGLFLIEALRKEHADLPILAVSGYDRREAAFRAGANAFLHYDAWLSLGRVIEDMLRTKNTPNPSVALNADTPISFGAVCFVVKTA